MNKNLDVKLHDFHIKRIKTWLELPGYLRHFICPFAGLNHVNSQGLCDRVFPDMNVDPFRKRCPCGAYGLDSVTKVAKELIRRNAK